jgi:L-lactate dehydrogenase
LRGLIGEELGLHPKNIHSYVIGEHGDTALVPWSCSVIGLNRVSQFLNQAQQDRILKDVRRSAYEIIERKGSTFYGIGICLKDIVDGILEDGGAIKTVSVYDEQNKIYYGMPAVLSKGGVVKRLELELSDIEKEKLKQSIEAIKKIDAMIGFC